MVQTPTKPITLDEFLQQPETKPASEYIEGHIIQKPMPQGKHSIIQTEFATTVNLALKPHKRGLAFTELRCTFDGRSLVPDIAVITWPNIPRDPNGEIANHFAIAPDWTIEILSPDQNQTKVIKNILHCLNNGTQMGWLIDPDDQTIFVYLPQQQPQVFEHPSQSLPVPPFAHPLTLTVDQVFGWLLG